MIEIVSAQSSFVKPGDLTVGEYYYIHSQDGCGYHKKILYVVDVTYDQSEGSDYVVTGVLFQHNSSAMVPFFRRGFSGIRFTKLASHPEINIRFHV